VTQSVLKDAILTNETAFSSVRKDATGNKYLVRLMIQNVARMGEKQLEKQFLLEKFQSKWRLRKQTQLKRKYYNVCWERNLWKERTKLNSFKTELNDVNC
jgi:hypothetical protein